MINFTRYDFLGEKSNASQKISERMIIQERRRDIAKRDSVREMGIYKAYRLYNVLYTCILSLGCICVSVCMFLSVSAQYTTGLE